MYLTNSLLGAVLVQLVHTKSAYKQYCYKTTRFGAECMYQGTLSIS